MARVRLNFQSLTLFEDEEWGDTHMALYATVLDSGANTLASFRWNNVGIKVNETNTYPLNNDPSNPNVIDFEATGPTTISVAGFADDGHDWPTAANNENSLGGASVVFDPGVLGTLGSLTVGPTTTDNGNTGYQVRVDVSVIPEPTPAVIRLKFENLILYEDEEWGDTHMAIYVYAQAPGLAQQEVFRWNNAGNKVNEVNSYNLDNGGNSTIVTLTVNGPATVWVEGYADDNQDWPSSGSNENSLGSVVITVDPNDPSTLGERQLGPTQTDNGNTGYVINLGIDVLPGGGVPSLAIVGVEVTQAIQHFQSSLGSDNSVPLVANKLTLVRVYLDSGLDPSVNGGQAPNVTGTLTANGLSSFTISPISPITAQPISLVDRAKIIDSLNFFIPPESANGSLNLVVEASVPGVSTSNPASLSISFTESIRLDILIFLIRNGAVGPVTEADYITAVNQLPIIYPIATDPAQSIKYWVHPQGEVYVNTHDLTTDDGMNDLLGDLEDLQEDDPSVVKAYGMVSNAVFMFRAGRAWEDDNVAIGHPGVLSPIFHELGHLYGISHAPCGNPDGVDDDFVPPDGSIGDVGVDVVRANLGDVGAAFPSSWFDFMSYCGQGGGPFSGGSTQWISAYHWIELLNNLLSGP